MRIPRRLVHLLEGDQALDGAVKLSISQFEPWIKHSHLPFFPDYTKHDLDHIEGVLRTAVSLIADDAWKALTPADAAVLILSVLLHDCAMHLSEDGFNALLHDGRSTRRVDGLSDKPWPFLWEDYMSEARRFDGRTLIKIFGSPQPVTWPPPDTSSLTKRDRLLIGEFLRRHHPRLAQEIALFGVPAHGNPVFVLDGLSGNLQHITHLAAIIARSHGNDVRSYLPYLKAHFDERQYKGVHPVFLMTLLRVGDYLQLDSERAPDQVLRIRHLASPVSRGEWKAHHAIKDIRHTHEDPEALFLDAFPPDVETFFRVKSWLVGIQQELDASWAVLGEVYGRYTGLDGLGLVIRRVRSSLDDVDAFAKKVPYLPMKAAFRAADADLLKLLIEPLYNNRFDVGLRELIQNAVDAVRELVQYKKDIHGIDSTATSATGEDVAVEIEKNDAGEFVVTVRDRGIGMTPHVVVEYFLAAGASFRRSEEWRKSFETSDGRSKVLRAGRFGVGALASFLIGPEIEVSTRHIDGEDGIQFTATVESDSIELRRIPHPIGTTVRIRASADVAKKIEAGYSTAVAQHAFENAWDWYCWSQPVVVRRVLGRALRQNHHIPEPGSELPPEWRRMTHPDYQDLIWTYSAAPALTCNGIVIRSKREGRFPGMDRAWRRRYGLRVPNISVADPDGRLPLNLQRTDLAASTFPFVSELAADVIRDLIAFALVNGPMWAMAGSQTTEPAYIGGVRRPWYVTSSGFGYLDASILSNHGNGSVLLVKGAGQDFIPFVDRPTILAGRLEGLTDTDEWVRELVDLGQTLEPLPFDVRTGWSATFPSLIGMLPRRGMCILMSFEATRRIEKLPKKAREMLKEEWTKKGWTLYSLGASDAGDFDFKAFASAADGKTYGLAVIAECSLSEGASAEPSPIGAAWMRILRQAEIPFDRPARRRQLGHALRELAPYVRAHEQAAIQGKH